MMHNTDSSIVRWSLFLALATASTPMVAPLLIAPGLAQSPTPAVFPLPSTVQPGTTVRIDGSSSMATLNQALKQQFEQKYAGTQVNLAETGTPEALQALLDGKIDLAAIGRPLTAEEKARGLNAIPIARPKIAIVVSPDNPFTGSLTNEQFARIFRGEITNWSEVGGPAGPIQLIDRPANSDTRQAFRNYPPFQTAPFETGATAVKLDQDSATAMMQRLGRNGIGYAIANQVVNQPGVRIVPLHNVLPTDPRYAFSQPLAYIYNAAQPSPGAAAFLGYAIAPATQDVIATGLATEAPVATGAITTAQASPVPASPGASPAATPGTAATPRATATLEATISPGEPIAPGTVTPEATSPGTATPKATAIPGAQTAAPETRAAGLPWLWWLLPLGLLALLLGWLARRRSQSPAIEPPTSLPISPPEAAPAAPAVEPPEPEASTLPVPPPIEGAALAEGTTLAAAAAFAADREDERADAEPAAPIEAAEIPVEAEPATPAAPLSPTDGWDLLAVSEPATPTAEFVTPSTPIDPTEGWDLLAPETAVSVATTPGGEAAIASEASLTAGVGEFVASDSPEQLPETLVAAEPFLPTAPSIAPIAAETLPTEQAPSPAMPSGAILAAGIAAASLPNRDPAQSDVEASKFDVGQGDLRDDALANVDEGLPPLPDGYGGSHIVLLPRDPQWAFAYWDVPNEHREAVRRQGGQRLALRIYDVTAIDLNQQSPHSVQQYDCDELARNWYIAIPASDRDYIAEIGYLTADDRWLMLARSNPIRVPPVFPSDWFEEKFLEVNWDDDLRGKVLLELLPPGARTTTGNPLDDKIFGLAESTEALRVAGSLFGSMQHVPGSVPGSAQMIPGSAQMIPGPVSSYVTASGMGMWASGVAAVPTMSGLGLTMSGVGMSGVGFFASMPPIRDRKFWLVAEAELIIYGATEPDASVTIAGQPIKLNPDGTFRFQMAFPDGRLDFPILAIAADGEQNRAIHLQFSRETPVRRTNTREDAIDELF
jgi:ABC-type phosphate transport system substrate-binding protein